LRCVVHRLSIVNRSRAQKCATLRTRLAQEIGIGSHYDLDRLDLTVQSTLNGALQHQVTDLLRRLPRAGIRRPPPV